MQYRSRPLPWRASFPILVGSTALASLAYVPLDSGPVVSNLPEIAIPLAVSTALVAFSLRLRDGGFDVEQIERIVKAGWIGALVSASIGAWWVGLHLFQGVPIAGLNDKILTLTSCGVAAGVFIEGRNARRRRSPTDADRQRVLGETTWTGTPGPNPILVTVAELLGELDGVDPVEMDSPIYDHVDPDVFARLATHDDSRWQLRFQADDYEVRVSSYGTVTVYERARSVDGDLVVSVP